MNGATFRRGVVFSCDVPTREFVLFLNETKHFVIEQLDEKHLLIDPSFVTFVEDELSKAFEKNVFVAER
ncbi:TFIIH subunit TTDA/Tfb5 [Pelagophyceae sp. CCMP2097]|nr:TFIIH subunit TTDA/Tfb5 [Pelagophyceae sp. CCMP2097]